MPRPPPVPLHPLLQVPPRPQGDTKLLQLPVAMQAPLQAPPLDLVAALLLLLAQVDLAPMAVLLLVAPMRLLTLARTLLLELSQDRVDPARLPMETRLLVPTPVWQATTPQVSVPVPEPTPPQLLELAPKPMLVARTAQHHTTWATAQAATTWLAPGTRLIQRTLRPSQAVQVVQAPLFQVFLQPSLVCWLSCYDAALFASSVALLFELRNRQHRCKGGLWGWTDNGDDHIWGFAISSWVIGWCDGSLLLVSRQIHSVGIVLGLSSLSTALGRDEGRTSGKQLSQNALVYCRMGCAESRLSIVLSLRVHGSLYAVHFNHY
jgi:hypothetical protein